MPVIPESRLTFRDDRHFNRFYAEKQEAPEPPAVTGALQSFQQNHAVEYSLVHEFIELRFVCILLGETVNFYRRVFLALDVLVGGVLGYSELLADGLGAFSALCFFPVS